MNFTSDDASRAAMAAGARWGAVVGRPFIEQAAVGTLTNWLARAHLDVATPQRCAIPVDLVAVNDHLKGAPLQVKGVATGGLTVWAKYTGHPGLTLVYTVLGVTDGGSRKGGTVMYVLDPDTAWRLPVDLGLAFEPDVHTTYRWPSITRDLADRLAPHTASTPAELRTLLGL
jgi:hypothetical protein